MDKCIEYDPYSASCATTDQNSYSCMQNPPIIRSSANARERDRTYSVNSAFITLRTLIPTEPADRKLSKIETLRLATSYISHLHTVLMAGIESGEQPCVLRHKQQGGRGSSICTFCLSASKMKSPNSNKELRSDSHGLWQQPTSCRLAVQ
ncbi:hypothetical protein CAPTEDRAFT_225943 [Capitella teleta]|uniref:BHLH domain-containing protein n=1 Tax=Capitella teleta TaxID=283909 RepID=R7TCD8_CAPTE|nr:hypothetical protein CAPTEDRAFT_225943 [Capitella teleta]|eukprot:ELT91187.1 hypothetical protein CAPTEDRAFT_225943 [Capitella teleta]